MSNRFKKTRPPQFETDGRKLRARRGTKASSGSTNTQRNDLPSDLPWSIQMVAPDHLKRSPRNTRVHPKTQISQIVNSIHEFGYTNPPLVDERNKIIGGHARIEAAQCAGLERIPVVVIPGLSEVKKRALALADNRIAENAGWDRAHLARELSELGPLLLEAGLDIDLTGFEPAQVDALINDHVDPERDPIDELPEISREPVSQKGDLWLLGKSRLFCGDATDPEDVRKLMGREQATMVFTDPPYNVKIASVQGRGKIKHREFMQASGEMSRRRYTRFLVDSFSLAAKHSINGSIHFVCIDWRHNRELQDAGEEVYTELKNLIVWVKTNGGMGTFYRSQHELIFVFKNGQADHVNNFELGQHGRNRTNVWSYAGVNTFRAGRLDDLTVHPTVKPVALVVDAIRDCSRRGDIVLDPFMGSGTTILASERVGRCGYGLELDPIYIDAAIRRWQIFTKRDAVLAGTHSTFDEAAAQRSSNKREKAK